jgi:hypothetical protein
MVDGVRHAARATIIDVIENLLSVRIDEASEQLRNADRQRFEQLAEGVADFYAAYEPPATGHDEYRTYFGGWIAGNFGTAEIRRYLRSALLYADATVLHDPVAEWFFPSRNELRSLPPIAYSNGLKIQSSEPAMLKGDGHYARNLLHERELGQVASALDALADLAPLIRSGLAIPVNHLELVRGSLRTRRITSTRRSRSRMPSPAATYRPRRPTGGSMSIVSLNLAPS